MKRSLYIIFAAIVALAVIVVFLRFVVGGLEDDWICDNGEWVKHGAPSAPKPTTGCGDDISIKNVCESINDMEECAVASGCIVVDDNCPCYNDDIIVTECGTIPKQCESCDAQERLRCIKLICPSLDSSSYIQTVIDSNSNDADTWQSFTIQNLDLTFLNPPSFDPPVVSPGINISRDDPMTEWEDIVIRTEKISLSFTQRPDAFSAYEMAWSNTYYSKTLDLSMTPEEMRSVLEESFLNISGVAVVEDLIVEFYQLGEYSGEYSLLYRAIKPHATYGNVLVTYVMDSEFYSGIQPSAHTEANEKFNQEIASPSTDENIEYARGIAKSVDTAQ